MSLVHLKKMIPQRVEEILPAKINELEEVYINFKGNFSELNLLKTILQLWNVRSNVGLVTNEDK